MAALNATYPTLLDITKRLDPQGKIDSLAEILNQVNPLMDYLPMVEGNLPTGHRSSIRSGLPTVAFRKLYGGVLPDKSKSTQVTDSCGMLEAYAEVDKALADLNGNTAAFRLSEDKAWIEAMSQKAASSIFYANEQLVPEGFTGLTPRYNSNTAENADNMISCYNTNSTGCTSIWLLGMSPETVFGIYPKGSLAGLHMEDKGQVTIENAGNDTNFTGRMEAYRTHYRWDLGLVVRDWRYAVRAHSILQTVVSGTLAAGPDLVNLMVQMEERIPNLSGVTPVFCMNRHLLTALRLQKLKKVAYNLTEETVAGKHITMFDGIPVLRTDALTYTETGLAVAAEI